MFELVSLNRSGEKGKLDAQLRALGYAIIEGDLGFQDALEVFASSAVG